MVRKPLCHHRIRTQNEGVREQRKSYGEFHGGNMEHGRAEECIQHFKNRTPWQCEDYVGIYIEG
jgi:hypothetical protein